MSRPQRRPFPDEFEVDTLTVEKQTILNSETVSTGDNILLLNNDVVGIPTENAGIEVQRGTSANSQLLWNETSDAWQAAKDGNNILDEIALLTKQQTITNKTFTMPQWTAYTKATLPAAGTAGRLARVTDTTRDLWMDQGTQWFALNGETVNVKEFGAVGDGITNDSVAIQAAINAGNTVWFPTGTYLCNLLGSPSYRRFVGSPNAVLLNLDGQANTTLTTTVYNTTGTINNASTSLTVADASNIAVGAIIRVAAVGPGSSNQSTTLSSNLIAGDTTVSATVDSSWPITGVLIIDSEVISYTGTTAGSFTGCTRGVYGTTATTHSINATVYFAMDLVARVLTVSGTTITLDTAASLSIISAPVVTGSIHIYVDGLRFDGNKGINAAANPMCLFIGQVAFFGITNCLIQNADHGGIFVENSRDGYIVGNTLRNNGQASILGGANIWIYHGSQNIRVAANYVGGNDSSHGILVDNRTTIASTIDYPCTENVISGNSIDSISTPSARGINVESCSRNIVSNNTIRNTAIAIIITQAQGTGVSIVPSDNLVMGNTIQNCTTGLSSTGTTNFFGNNKIINTTTPTSLGTNPDFNNGAMTSLTINNINVGIGKTPTQSLDVSGAILASGHGAFGAGGGISTTVIFNAIENFTNISGNMIGIQGQATVANSGPSSASFIGVFGKSASSSAAAAVTGSMRGIWGFSQWNSTATCTNFYGIIGEVANSSTGIVTNAYGGNFGYTNTKSGGGGTISNGFGVYIYTPENTGTITNAYGLYIAPQTTVTNTNVPFGIYQAGTADYNYFGGKTGIGTSAPGGLLHIATSATAGMTIFEQASADTNSYTLSIRKARGTVSSPTVITVGDTLGTIIFRGYSGAGGYVTAAQLQAVSMGTIATTRVSSYLAFSIGTDAAPTALTERMRLDNLGNLLLATTSVGTSAAGTLTLGLGTAPTTSAALCHVYCANFSANNAVLAVYQESTVITAAAVASTHKIPVVWNGAAYYLLASNV